METLYIAFQASLKLFHGKSLKTNKDHYFRRQMSHSTVFVIAMYIYPGL